MAYKTYIKAVINERVDPLIENVVGTESAQIAFSVLHEEQCEFFEKLIKEQAEDSEREISFYSRILP